jgi:hypothetical protein
MLVVYPESDSFMENERVKSVVCSELSIRRTLHVATTATEFLSRVRLDAPRGETVRQDAPYSTKDAASQVRRQDRTTTISDNREEKHPSDVVATVTAHGHHVRAIVVAAIVAEHQRCVPLRCTHPTALD